MADAGNNADEGWAWAVASVSPMARAKFAVNLLNLYCNFH